jgi:predicted RNA-binding protein associated with RNAse of E/G family
MYRFRNAGGEVIGHRFDAVSRVAIADDVVEYDDAILDWWVLPTGEVIEEDADEFEEARAAGTLAASAVAKAEAARRAILGRYRHIIDDAASLERRFLA